MKKRLDGSLGINECCFTYDCSQHRVVLNGYDKDDRECSIYIGSPTDLRFALDHQATMFTDPDKPYRQRLCEPKVSFGTVGSKVCLFRQHDFPKKKIESVHIGRSYEAQMIWGDLTRWCQEMNRMHDARR